MGVDNLNNTTISLLLQNGYEPKVLREAFDRAFVTFTDHDWIAAAKVAMSADDCFENLTYLFLASQEGWEDVVEKLLKHETPVLAMIKTPNGEWSTAIHVAFLKNHKNILMKLFASTASLTLNYHEHAGLIGLIYSKSTSPELFEYFARHINVYSRAREQSYPDWVELASYRRHDIFCYLLKKGLIKDQPTKNEGLQYFGFCVNSIELTEDELMANFKSLLSSGIYLNHEDNLKRTAFTLAVTKGWFKLARLIVGSNSYFIANRSKAHLEVFSYLFENNHLEFLSYLISNRFLGNINNITRDPLICSDMWRTFIENHTDVKAKKYLSLIAASVDQAHDYLKLYFLRVVDHDFQYPTGIFRPDWLIDDIEVQACSTKLFEEVYPENGCRDKNTAIKIALARCYRIMEVPGYLLSLLHVFEEQLKGAWNREFNGQSIKSALECETVLQEYAGVFYPVPRHKNRKQDKAMQFSKNGFLERECLEFMRARGYSTRFIKFYDAVFDGTFESTIKSNVMFTECNLNPHALIHGKNVHNLARIAIIIAWEQGYFNKSYSGSFHPGEISLQDLFSAMVDPEFSHPMTKKTTWATLFDTAEFGRLTFSDPFKMHGLLMVNSRKALPYLSHLMTHSFVKTVYRIQSFINDLTEEQWSAQEVWDSYISTRVPPIFCSNTKQMLTWLRDSGKLSQHSTVTAERPVGPHRFCHGLIQHKL